jgi:hypothetical protein
MVQDMKQEHLLMPNRVFNYAPRDQEGIMPELSHGVVLIEFMNSQ